MNFEDFMAIKILTVVFMFMTLLISLGKYHFIEVCTLKIQAAGISETYETTVYHNLTDQNVHTLNL
jgi:hypothetical protein